MFCNFSNIGGLLVAKFWILAARVLRLPAVRSTDMWKTWMERYEFIDFKSLLWVYMFSRSMRQDYHAYSAMFGEAYQLWLLSGWCSKHRKAFLKLHVRLKLLCIASLCGGQVYLLRKSASEIRPRSDTNQILIWSRGRNFAPRPSSATFSYALSNIHLKRDQLLDLLLELFGIMFRCI